MIKDDVSQSVEDAVNGVLVDLPSGEDVCEASVCGYRDQTTRAVLFGAECALRAASSQISLGVHNPFPKSRKMTVTDEYVDGVLSASSRLNIAADRLMSIREKL